MSNAGSPPKDVSVEEEARRILVQALIERIMRLEAELVAERQATARQEREKNLQIAKRAHLERWLMLIDGGDQPCNDPSTLRMWAMRALRGDEGAS